jgi:selenocysteine-specific elongation factor
MTPLTLGTAGHVDHGKTWLIRALTGTDTDRLPEERARGISIALGYARLELPDGAQLSVVDVPGHERFVRTMVAGATGIDLFLLVVDAREGPRAQTYEHLDILRLLGVERGVVAVTKADAVHEGTLEVAVAVAQELVPRAEVVAVSAVNGSGLDELREALARAAAGYERARRLAATRLYVDRVFSLRGIGTVATGTLWSGSVAVGDELELAPRGGRVRVRSVEVHGESTERADAGQRVALALVGPRPQRGDALVAGGAYPASYRLDVELDELAPLDDGARVLVHHGTSAALARVRRIGMSYAQLRLARPVVAARGDRLLLRRGTTIGGGRVLDPAPPRTVDLARVEALAGDDPLSALVGAPVRVDSLRRRALLDEDALDRALARFERAGEWVFAQSWLERTARAARERLRGMPDGLAAGELLGSAPWAGAVAPLLGLERRDGRLVLPGVGRPVADEAADALAHAVEAAGLEPLRGGDRGLLGRLEREGRVAVLGDGSAIGPRAYDEARALLVSALDDAGELTLAGYRDLLGVSRRVAQLLLERFDEDRVTLRVGEVRRLRKHALQR